MNGSLPLQKTTEWEPGDEGHGEESGSKGNADLGQIPWSSMSIPFQGMCMVGELGTKTGDPVKAVGSAFVSDAARASR